MTACRTCSDTDIKAVAAGGHTCVLLGCGLIECWGSGADGRLGHGSTNNVGDMLTPAEVGPLDFSAHATSTSHVLHALTVGDSHGCALVDRPAQSPGVSCWGNGGSGRLGDGNSDNLGDDVDDVLGVPVGIDESIGQISAGAAHTCALTSLGRVLCWGDGANGRLGNGDTSDILDAGEASEVDLFEPALGIAAGGAHTCALMAYERSVVCWGSGNDGRLGNGDTADVLTPASQTIESGVLQVSAGAEHTCAIEFGSGDVWCWGSGEDGRLGYGGTDDVGDMIGNVPSSTGPIDLGVHEAVQVAAGAAHTCVLTDLNEVLCWGYNEDGRLGYGDTDSRYAPDEVVLDNVLQLAVGGAHTCALLGTTDAPLGEVVCWGYGGDGRLGYGDTRTQTSVPADHVKHR